MNIEQLKARAYDILAGIQELQRQLEEVNKAIIQAQIELNQKSNEKSKSEEDKKAEEK